MRFFLLFEITFCGLPRLTEEILEALSSLMFPLRALGKNPIGLLVRFRLIINCSKFPLHSRSFLSLFTTLHWIVILFDFPKGAMVRSASGNARATLPLLLETNCSVEKHLLEFRGCRKEPTVSVDLRGLLFLASSM